MIRATLRPSRSLRPLASAASAAIASGRRATHSSTPKRSAAAAVQQPSVPSGPSGPSGWAQATQNAHNILAEGAAVEDPLFAIKGEIGELKASLFQMLGSSHPSLDAVAKYYFKAEGKALRPLLVLLMAQATNGLAGRGWESAYARAAEDQRLRSGGINRAVTEMGGVLNDWNPESMGLEPRGRMVFSEPFRITRSEAGTQDQLGGFNFLFSSNQPPNPPEVTHTKFADILPAGDGKVILPTQRRLASICEMIHVASLLHDDVIDASDLRRGAPSAPAAFGNKLSILAGDFLLGRASVGLARLGNAEVTELLSTTVANLVEGEVIQLKATTKPAESPTQAGFEEYMRKTYLKTASLMAKGARCAVILGGCGEGSTRDAAWIKDVAYGYGRNLGIAFQLVDDMLDFLPASADLGKPGSGADLRLGLATAPALFAWEEHPELGPLIRRKFSEDGDTATALELVKNSQGLQRTGELAKYFANEAKELIMLLPPSEARDALVDLTIKVVDRVK